MTDKPEDNPQEERDDIAPQPEQGAQPRPDGDRASDGKKPADESDADSSPVDHLGGADDSDADVDIAAIMEEQDATEDKEAWTFGLDESEEPPQRSLDICPNCTADIDETMQMVCMNCGYNLRTMKVERTVAGVEERDPDEELDEHGRVKRPPLSPPGRGGTVLPLVIASGCAIALLAGLLAGHHGLFAAYVNAQDAEPASVVVGWATRFTGMLRYVVNTGTWAGVVLASLWLFARVMEQPLGEANLVLARAVGMACAMKLASLVPVTTQAIRFPLEMGGHFAILFGLAMAFLKMSPKTAGFFTLMTIIVMMITYLASTLIVWSIG